MIISLGQFFVMILYYAKFVALDKNHKLYLECSTKISTFAVKIDRQS